MYAYVKVLVYTVFESRWVFGLQSHLTTHVVFVHVIFFSCILVDYHITLMITNPWSAMITCIYCRRNMAFQVFE